MGATRKIEFFFLILLLLGYSSSILAMESNLPTLMEAPPDRLYRILGPVGATKKKVSQARSQLRIEAKKMDADAVIGVVCKEGGIRRQGLSWANEAAYCRGLGVKYIEEKDK